MRKIDLSGTKFGRFEVLARDHRQSGHWICRCVCGQERSVKGTHLRSGKSRSCGCLRLEIVRKGFTHGLTVNGERHPLYEVWSSMRARCNNPNNKSYKRYGGRGIKVCARWDDFAAFLTDMGDRPAGHSIDRINPYGDYTPENCRWADIHTQANNTRSNIYIERDGRRLSIMQWSRESGVPYRVLWERIAVYKWPLDRAFSEPIRKWPSQR